MKNFNFVCKDFELTDPIKNYLVEKLSSLHKYLNVDEEATTFHCRLGKVSNSHNHGKIFYAEVSIHTPEKNFGGRVEAETIYASIDLLKDELAQSIANYKGKVRTLNKKEALKFKDEIHNYSEE